MGCVAMGTDADAEAGEEGTDAGTGGYVQAERHFLESPLFLLIVDVMGTGAAVTQLLEHFFDNDEEPATDEDVGQAEKERGECA